MDFGPAIGGPLVSDRRLTKVANALRKEYPQLPDACEFVTFDQPHTFVEIEGIQRPIPHVAVFGIQVPNPKYEGMTRLFSRTATMDWWREQDYDARHQGDVHGDALYRIYKAVLFPPRGDGVRNLVEQVIDWHQNMKDLMN